MERRSKRRGINNFAIVNINKMDINNDMLSHDKLYLRHAIY